MTSLGNPVVALMGVALMALACWWMSRYFPLLATESRVHASTLPLDGLRGLLAAAVFFHHAYMTYVYRQTGAWIEPASNFYGQLGSSAVTLFFFISGFLFWGKMLRDPESVQAGRLWPNRMRRIMPAYWAAVACAFVAIAVFSGFRLQESPAVLVEHAGTWVMVGFPFQPGINGMDQEPVTAGVYWTLRVELLFYLVLPALAWFRRGWRPLLVILMALALNVGLHHLPIPDLATDGAVLTMKQFTAAIVTGFSVGALAAYLPMFVQSDGWMQRWLCSRWAAGAATALLAVQFFLVRGTFSWQEPILLAPAFFMVVAGNGFCGVLTSRPVRCLGQISYSFYIFHGIVLFAVTSSVNLYYPIETMNVALYWSMMLTTGVLVVALCTLSYWFVERPFFKGMARGVRASIAAKA